MHYQYKVSFFLLPLLTPVVALAQQEVSRLTAIPFVNESSIGGVVEGLFYLAIVVAGMLAVVKLVIAGAKYMMNDVVTTKQSALGDIKGALIGLLLVLGTVVVLETINTDITNANLDMPSLGLDFDGWNRESALEEAIQQTCEDIGAEGDCDTMDCEYFDTINSEEYIGWIGGWIDWGVDITLDNPLNIGQCQARCNWISGQRIPGSMGESGVCVYPNDAVQAKSNLIELTNESILDEAEEPIEGYDSGDSLKICSTQVGPTACQSTEEACTSGRMSIDGESGSPTNTNIEGVGRVVVCNF